MYERIQTDFDIHTIKDSGQVFRIRPLSAEETAAASEGSDGASWGTDGIFLAAAGKHAVFIRQQTEQEGRVRLFFSCTEAEFSEFWENYFDLGTDYGAIRRSVNPKDAFLSSAVRFGYGIRILRQDLWETIISFLISQNNNITRIRRSIEALCARYGKPCAPAVLPAAMTGSPSDTPAPKVHAFPTPEAILAEPDSLSELGLGYRDKYILRMAQRCAGPSGREWLQRLQESSYEDALRLLLAEYGIGKKVADCICLFGLHHVEAFPIDTHVRQILAACYPDGFPFDRYDGFAGILQQYMFYYKLQAKKIQEDDADGRNR